MENQMTFDEIIDKVYELWGDQKEKSILAEKLMEQSEKLMEDCETIEAEMVSLLKTAEEMYPAGYEEFLQSFKEVEN